MSNGWVKVYRKLWENPRAKDPEWVAVWIYLLCQATNQNRDVVWKGKQRKLKPGQFITGQLKIVKKTGVNRSKVRRVLNWLQNDQQIDKETSNASTLITIINWSNYQAIDHPATTNKNEENEKNGKEEREIPRPCEGIWWFADMIRFARPEFEKLNEMTVVNMLKTAMQSGMDVEANVQDFVTDAANMFVPPPNPIKMLRNYLYFDRHRAKKSDAEEGGWSEYNVYIMGIGKIK